MAGWGTHVRRRRRRPAVTVTTRDVRCAMVNCDPEGGRPSPEVLRAVVRVNEKRSRRPSAGRDIHTAR